MGSEKRQKSFRGNLKSVVTLLFPPRFDRAAFKTRRYLPERLNFPQAPRARGSMRGAERLRVLDESCELRGQTWGGLTASRRTSETWVSTLTVLAPIELFLQHGSSCVPAQSSVQAVQRDRNECIASTDRPCLLSTSM